MEKIRHGWFKRKKIIRKKVIRKKLNMIVVKLEMIDFNEKKIKYVYTWWLI